MDQVMFEKLIFERQELIQKLKRVNSEIEKNNLEMEELTEHINYLREEICDGE